MSKSTNGIYRQGLDIIVAITSAAKFSIAPMKEAYLRPKSLAVVREKEKHRKPWLVRKLRKLVRRMRRATSKPRQEHFAHRISRKQQLPAEVAGRQDRCVPTRGRADEE